MQKVAVPPVALGSGPRGVAGRLAGSLGLPRGSCRAAGRTEAEAGSGEPQQGALPPAEKLQTGSYAELHASAEFSEPPAPTSEPRSAGGGGPAPALELLPDPSLSGGFGSGSKARDSDSCGRSAPRLPAAVTSAAFSWDDFNDPLLTSGGAGVVLKHTGSGSPASPGKVWAEYGLPAVDSWSGLTEHDASVVSRYSGNSRVLSPQSPVPARSALLHGGSTPHSGEAALHTRFAEGAPRQRAALDSCASPHQSPTRPAAAGGGGGRWGDGAGAGADYRFPAGGDRESWRVFDTRTHEESDSRVFWAGYAADSVAVTSSSFCTGKSPAMAGAKLAAAWQGPAAPVAPPSGAAQGSSKLSFHEETHDGGHAALPASGDGAGGRAATERWQDTQPASAVRF